jgi:hypothetical protein
MTTSLKAEIEAVQGALIALDGLFDHTYHNAPANSLEPTREFLLAWHQVKQALSNINAIQTKDIAV